MLYIVVFGDAWRTQDAAGRGTWLELRSWNVDRIVGFLIQWNCREVISSYHYHCPFQ